MTTRPDNEAGAHRATLTLRAARRPSLSFGGGPCERGSAAARDARSRRQQDMRRGLQRAGSPSLLQARSVGDADVGKY
eukprot:CAMPEP_0185487240 /NCGR_PEP_ID=MMETSP1366-20130426/11463_1 /TAXON_ID=38817 /ORGANISM="Gephyrocapsa oceanica, Strain RCC1303" /LENGTH=77 /DNA_ID=CAMNT_0028095565 /DNA_START=122 /DNA_END=353 /DNA_ORIENTATION=+